MSHINRLITTRHTARGMWLSRHVACPTSADARHQSASDVRRRARGSRHESASNDLRLSAPNSRVLFEVSLLNAQRWYWASLNPRMTAPFESGQAPVGAAHHATPETQRIAA